MSDDLMIQIAHTLSQLDRRLARLEVVEFGSGGTAGTASMTAGEILTALKTVDGTGSLLDADLLDGLEGAAYSGTAHTHSGYVGTASYTASDVLAKLLTVDGTSSLLDADKLDGLEGAAYAGTATVTAGTILAKLLTVDGTGSGLDSDTVDGYHAADILAEADVHWRHSYRYIQAPYFDFGTACLLTDADGAPLNQSTYYRARAWSEVGDGAAVALIHSNSLSTGDWNISHLYMSGSTGYSPRFVLQGGTPAIHTWETTASFHVVVEEAQAGTGTYSTAANGSPFEQGNFSDYLGAAVFDKPIDTNGTATALVLRQGGGTILTTDRTAAESILSIGNGRAQDGNAMIRLVGDTTYTAYGVELYRYAGANGSSAFFHRGTGDLQFTTVDAAAWKVLTNNALRLTISATGDATFTGSVTVQTHLISNGASGAMTLTAKRFSMADAAVVTIGNLVALVEVVDATQANVGLFFIRGGVNSVQEIYDPSGIFTTTKDSANSINVYYETSTYKIQNKRGGTRSIALNIRDTAA